MASQAESATDFEAVIFDSFCESNFRNGVRPISIEGAFGQAIAIQLEGSHSLSFMRMSKSTHRYHCTSKNLPYFSTNIKVLSFCRDETSLYVTGLLAFSKSLPKKGHRSAFRVEITLR
jgi:hypothetical protein